MKVESAISFARKVLQWANVDEVITPHNFARLSQTVVYLIKQWSVEQRANEPHLRDFLLTWKKIYEDFDEMVRRDPMMLYQPKHSVAEAFHRSLAARRYFRAGNRSAKTQSGIAEHHFVATKWHPFRPYPSGPTTSVILSGLPFTIYAPKVFEKKFLYGEDENTLSPIYPDNGKWFYHYDSRQRIITIACPECANKGQAQSCPGHHSKSTISLLSIENGVGVLEAFSATLGHIDEFVPEEFYHALKQRLASVRGSSMIITGTPLNGTETWETTLLAATAEAPRHLNLSDPENPKSPPLVEMFQIDQFAAGIVDHAKIRESMADMDEFEIEARIYGRPTALADRPVFDRTKLIAASKLCVTPRYGQIELVDHPEPMISVRPQNYFQFGEVTIPTRASDFTGVRIWEEPVLGRQYIAAVDSAAGLAPGTRSRIPDASCCSILKVEVENLVPKLKLVAQFWGWINPLDYGLEVVKLCKYYNDALCVIELTGGLGRSVMLRVKELCYWNLYREPSKPENAKFQLDPRLGVETSAASKPAMVSMLQQFIKDSRITIYDMETIHELKAFEQVVDRVGGQALQTPKYKGAGGTKDDRVMSLAIGVAVFVSNVHLFNLVNAVDTKNVIQSNPDPAIENKWKEIREEIEIYNEDDFSSEISYFD